jgi:hypothetical protein
MNLGVSDEEYLNQLLLPVADLSTLRHWPQGSSTLVYVAVADLSTLLKPFTFIAIKDFNVIWISIFWLWSYLMKVIRAHLICFFRIAPNKSIIHSLFKTQPSIRWHSMQVIEPHTTIYDKVCRWLATGRWFYPGTLVSSTNKSDCHDITEILLKVAINTINQSINHNHCVSYISFI